MPGEVAAYVQAIAVYCVFVVLNFVVSSMPGEPSTLPGLVDGAQSLLAWPMGILPVSPGQAMALLLIPGYNIWGIWAMWRVADSRLPRVAALGAFLGGGSPDRQGEP